MSPLGAIFLTVFIDLVGFGIVMPFLSLQAREVFGVDEATATLLGASYSLAQFLFVPLWGRLSDRIGRRPVLLVSIALTMVTMAGLGGALAYGHTVIWLFLARIFGGIATANLGTASAYIADITTPQERLKGMGLIGMAFGLGFIVGPGLGGLLAEWTVNGREGPMACFFAAFLSAVNLVWAYVAVKESLPKSQRLSQKPRRGWPMDISLVKGVLAVPYRGRVVLAQFLLILAFSGLEVTYAFFARDRFSLDLSEVGWLFVLMGVMGALTQGGFIRRVGHRYQDSSLILWGIGLQAAAFFLFVASGHGELWLLVLASCVLAVGNGISQPSLSGFLSRRTQAHEQGQVLSVFHAFSSLARVFGPALGGVLYYSLGAVWPFIIGGVINVLATALALHLRRYHFDLSSEAS